jgi:hypothetical protein
LTLRAGIVLAISFLSTFRLAAAAPSSGQLSDGFPVEQGTYWTYECDTIRKDLNSPPVRKSFSWKMEILETLQQHDLVIALVRGHLDDLPGINEPKRGDYLVVAVRNRKFYLVAPPNSQDLLRHLKQTHTDWAPLVQGQGRLFLELPLVAGKGFPTEQAARENSSKYRPGFDSWLVKNKRALRLDSLKTNVSLANIEQYCLVYGLNKSEKRLDFVPGVGITEYDYHGYAGVPPAHAEWKGLCKLIQYHRERPLLSVSP